jgi:hypothetical protein
MSVPSELINPPEPLLPEILGDLAADVPADVLALADLEDATHG